MAQPYREQSSSTPYGALTLRGSPSFGWQTSARLRRRSEARSEESQIRWDSVYHKLLPAGRMLLLTHAP